LTELKEGQHATVLQLPVEPERGPKRIEIQQDSPENIRA
jgi:hypothetical protein